MIRSMTARLGGREQVTLKMNPGIRKHGIGMTFDTVPVYVTVHYVSRTSHTISFQR